ncbi:phosphoenolpyruvate carboxylase, partial [Bacteroidia bacterium]|nr:phosphoenolpyruvate carboxylase [Bacteroidia bacterium]
MSKSKLKTFDQHVKTKFHVYNGLFLDLPYRKLGNIGKLIPLLADECATGLGEDKNPSEILNSFFAQHTSLATEQEKIDFMFRVIHYVERQVVLYDSVEDAAFEELNGEKSVTTTIANFLQPIGEDTPKQNGLDWLSDFSTRIVFTAHPTQFYTPAVLDIIGELRELIPQNKINEIDHTLKQLSLTSLLNAEKPTPLVEAKNIIYYLRHVYYDAVSSFYTDLKTSFAKSNFNNPDIIKLGFWPGGDRDGNPFVRVETTMAVADELRINLMKCYYNDVKALQNKLTFSDVEPLLTDLRAKLYSTMFNAESSIPYEEIYTPLKRVRDIVEKQYYSLNIESIDALLDKIEIFKTHFATLDIRQDHDVHEAAVSAILAKAGYIKASTSELSTDELHELLRTSNIEVNAEDYSDELIRDVIQVIKGIKDIQQKNGEEGCNRYIISNSVHPSSVLYVFALFRWCGWSMDELKVDIIPLFETMEGMREAEQTMNTLFSMPKYRSHVEQRAEGQTIMLGFSDGTKDGGYFKANWSIFKTKEVLTKVCKENGVNALFFDGRGGPPSRGGGKSHRFYAAQSNTIANNEIQLTIQGQTITSNYGTKEQFSYNCEQLITAGLSKVTNSEKNNISDLDRQMLEQLSDLSFEKYDALKQHPKFIPYLEQKSTLKYYGRANIGSRPGKRGKKKELTL